MPPTGRPRQKTNDTTGNTTYDNVVREVNERRAKFIEVNDPARIEQQIKKTQDLLTDKSRMNTLFHRQQNHIRNQVTRKQQELRLAKRKRELFEDLSNEVITAARTVQSRNYYVKRRKLENATALPTGVQAVRTVLEDVMLWDTSTSTLIDTAIQVDDVCDCGQLMRRVQSMSCMVCPNPECHQMRTYIDTSTGSVPYSKTDSQNPSPRKKCLTHYTSFLRAIQHKTTKTFDRRYLLDLCRCCYIEGARSSSDIRKKIVNAAQSYINKDGKPEYTHTPLLICLLGGGLRKMPPDVENKLMMMIDAMIPVFEKHKHLLDVPKKAIKPVKKKDKDKAKVRNNMINFDFATRINLRMLGYKIYDHMAETFDLADNKLRHGWFMRLLYKDLGWEWIDGELADYSDEDLDRAYFCAMMLRKEHLRGEITRVRARVREIYEAKCHPGACNCFLHSYAFRNATTNQRTAPEFDAFEHLESFVYHVAERENGHVLDLDFVRYMAADFNVHAITEKGLHFPAVTQAPCC